jgi:hypothetical protein
MYVETLCHWSASIPTDAFTTETIPQASDLFSEAKIGCKGRFELLGLLFENQRILRLCHDTTFLAVRIIDRYSSKKSIPRKSLGFCYGVCLLVSANISSGGIGY